jgi:hypothetical protein
VARGIPYGWPRQPRRRLGTKECSSCRAECRPQPLHNRRCPGATAYAPMSTAAVLRRSLPASAPRDAPARNNFSGPGRGLHNSLRSYNSAINRGIWLPPPIGYKPSNNLWPRVSLPMPRPRQGRANRSNTAVRPSLGASDLVHTGWYVRRIAVGVPNYPNRSAFVPMRRTWGGVDEIPAAIVSCFRGSSRSSAPISSVWGGPGRSGPLLSFRPPLFLAQVMLLAIVGNKHLPTCFAIR